MDKIVFKIEVVSDSLIDGVGLRRVFRVLKDWFDHTNTLAAQMEEELMNKLLKQIRKSDDPRVTVTVTGKDSFKTELNYDDTVS